MKYFDWEQYILNYPDLEHLNTQEKAYTHYTRFGKNEGRIDYKLYHSIFYKNGIVYVIQPIYVESDMYFKLFDKQGKVISLTSQIIKDQWEPIIISLFKIQNDQESIEVFLKFGTIKIKKILNHIKTTKDKFLSLTTLFKDDYKLINTFYDYYKKQGVEHFYLYYNGKFPLPFINDKEDITFIEWNSVYHSRNAYISPHIAQTGQIHDAIYRYGKDNSEYMIFCDLDEYLFCGKTNVGKTNVGKTNVGKTNVGKTNVGKTNVGENETIISYLQKNQNIDTFGFKQILAKSDQDPYISFPSEIYISETPFEYLNYKEAMVKRPSSKCIHKMDTIQTTSVHYHDHQGTIDTSNYFYHFFNWTQRNRTSDDQFKLLCLK